MLLKGLGVMLLARVVIRRRDLSTNGPGSSRGVMPAQHDFGTGYSSLAYLRQFPVDALKIDRSFISGIAASSESKALIHTLVQLGKTLGLETLGEGIEEQAQLRHLQREACDSGQGFLLARPLEPEAVDKLLSISSELSSE